MRLLSLVFFSSSAHLQIEQGGILSIANDLRTNVCTLSQAFSNAKYVLVFGIESSFDGGGELSNMGSISRTKTQFIYWAYSKYAVKSWYAAGY